MVADLGSIYVKNPGSIKRLPGFESGSFWVQDASGESESSRERKVLI